MARLAGSGTREDSMTIAERIAYIRRAMDSYTNDDLERATYSFKTCSASQMLEKYGQSDQTRQEIIDGYRREREDWHECAAWLSQLFGGVK
jgi:hypothetical protein